MGDIKRVMTGLNSIEAYEDNDPYHRIIDNRPIQNLLNNDIAIADLEFVFSGQKTFDDTVIMNSGLTVNGTVTIVNTTELNVADNIITLNYNVVGVPTLNAGIEVERGDSTNASLLWDETAEVWKIGLAGAEVQIADINYAGVWDVNVAKIYYNGGNVGIGVSDPLAKLSIYNGEIYLDYSNGGTNGAALRIGNNANNTVITNNNYYSGSEKYSRNGGSSQIRLFTNAAAPYASGDIVFSSALSGTADNAITYTDMMIIKQDGKLGIGTNTPSYKLHVIDNQVSTSSYYMFNNSSNAYGSELVVLNGGVAGGSGYARIYAQNSSGSYAGLSVGNSGASTGYYVEASVAVLHTNASTLRINTNATQNNGITINSSGYVGICTLSPNARLQTTGGSNTVPTFAVESTATPSTFQWVPGVDEGYAFFSGRGSSGGAPVLALHQNRTISSDYLGYITWLQPESGKNANSGIKAQIASKTVGSGGASYGYGAQLEFATRLDNGTFDNRMIISHDGKIQIASLAVAQSAAMLQVKCAEASVYSLWAENTSATGYGIMSAVHSSNAYALNVYDLNNTFFPFRVYGTGTVVIKPLLANNYNEGIRIVAANTGYATLCLGTDDTGSGTITGQWALIKLPVGALNSHGFGIWTGVSVKFDISTDGRFGFNTNVNSNSIIKSHSKYTSGSAVWSYENTDVNGESRLQIVSTGTGGTNYASLQVHNSDGKFGVFSVANSGVTSTYYAEKDYLVIGTNQPNIRINTNGTLYNGIVIEGTGICNLSKGGTVGWGNDQARKPIKFLSTGVGSYGDVAAINTDSNGDKLILWNDGNGFDSRIGIGDHSNTWFKCMSNTAVGSFEFFAGGINYAKLTVDYNNIYIGSTGNNIRYPLVLASTGANSYGIPNSLNTNSNGDRIVIYNDGSAFDARIGYDASYGGGLWFKSFSASSPYIEFLVNTTTYGILVLYNGAAHFRGLVRPDVHNTRNLGQTDVRWANGYFVNLYYSGSLSNSFTAGHDTHKTFESYEQGMIVVSNGNVLLGDGFDNTIPDIELSSFKNDSRVYGVIKEDLEECNIEEFKSLQLSNIARANAIGDGKILVCNVNGDISNGDFITTSDVLGLGMKQDDDLMHSYTVAKCTQSINWGDITTTVIHNGVEYKKTLIACTYHCG